MSEVLPVNTSEVAAYLLEWSKRRFSALRVEVESLPLGDERHQASRAWAEETDRQLTEIKAMLKV